MLSKADVERLWTMIVMAIGGMVFAIIGNDYQPTPNIFHLIGCALYVLSAVYCMVWLIILAAQEGRKRRQQIPPQT